jgi:hypothetical protein
MPATSVPLDAETQAMLGNFKEAARQIEKEWQQLQKKIAQDISSGKGVDRKLADKSIALRDQADNFKAQADRKRDIEKATKESTIKHVADLLNTHNPHAALGRALHGNVNANSFNSVGDMLKGLAGNSPMGKLAAQAGASLESAALGAAAPAAILGMLVKAGFEIAQTRADSELAGAKLDLAGNSRSLNTAINARFQGGAALTNQLIARHLAGEAAAGAEHHGFIDDFLNGPERRARAREFGRDVFDFKARYAGSTSADQLNRITDLKGASHLAEIENRLGYVEKGFFGWVKSQTVDRLTGAREAEREELVRTRAQRYMAAMDKEYDAIKRTVTDNPAYKVHDIDAARQAAAFRSFELERYCQWNMI